MKKKFLNTIFFSKKFTFKKIFHNYLRNIKPRKLILRKKTQLKLLNNNLLNTFLFKDKLYTKLLGSVFKAGKKLLWHNLFSILFTTLSLKLKYSRSFIIAKIFARLYTKVEIKKRELKTRVVLVPKILKPKRSLFLSLKILFSVLKKKTDQSFKTKLFVEFLALLSYRTCFSVQKILDINRQAFLNRSNAHFRWVR